jgi:hypothetical protein
VNYFRIAVAGLAATVAYFAVGFLIFGLLPQLRAEFARFPAIYRTPEAMKQVMPAGMLGMLISILALAYLFAWLGRGVCGAVPGALFGALIGIFSIGAFVLHNYVNLNIGARLTFQQSVAYLIEWIVVGLVIGVLYRPVAST